MLGLFEIIEKKSIFLELELFQLIYKMVNLVR